MNFIHLFVVCFLIIFKFVVDITTKNRAKRGVLFFDSLGQYEQIELQAKLLNYFLGSNKSNINQKVVHTESEACRKQWTGPRLYFPNIAGLGPRLHFPKTLEA